MSQVIKAPFPHNFDGKKVFLAGSIEMGKAENWQERAEKLFPNDWMVLNPRRDDWDNSWEQKIENDQFRNQVEWELDGLEKSSWVLMYFSPGTQSPITLLELGLLAGSYSGRYKLVVVCPEGFWRKGNVDIVCKKFGIQQYDTIEEAISFMVEYKKRLIKIKPDVSW